MVASHSAPGNRIVDLEQRAHKAAKNKGKGDEVAASIPAAEKEDSQDDGADKKTGAEAGESEDAELQTKEGEAAKATVEAGAGSKKMFTPMNRLCCLVI